jgi:hypothetical protein
MTLRFGASIVLLAVLLQSGKTSSPTETKQIVDEILIVKSEHKMTRLNNGRVLHVYQVAEHDAGRSEGTQWRPQSARGLISHRLQKSGEPVSLSTACFVSK